MKKLIAIILAVSTIVLLTGCSTVSSDAPSQDAPKPASSISESSELPVPPADSSEEPISEPEQPAIPITASVDIQQYINNGMFDAEQCAMDLGYTLPTLVQTDNMVVAQYDVGKPHAYDVTLFGHYTAGADGSDWSHTVSILYLYNGGEDGMAALVRLSGAGDIGVSREEGYLLTEDDIKLYVAILEKITTMNGPPVDDPALGIVWEE